MLRAPNSNRRTEHLRAYNYRWKNAAKSFLRANPMCAIKGPNCLLTAYCVDHIKPHRRPAPGWYERFWSADNWQAACKKCHDEKTRAGL